MVCKFKLIFNNLSSTNYLKFKYSDYFFFITNLAIYSFTFIVILFNFFSLSEL